MEVVKSGNHILPRWTKSPDEEANFADWKIDVKCRNTLISRRDDNSIRLITEENTAASTVTTTSVAKNDVSYSVHRIFLGSNSDYFKSIFRVDGFSESHQKCSIIELPSPTVTLKHFEILLNYFYTGELHLNFSNAVAIVYFGDYFGIMSLKTRARSFIGNSIADCSKSIGKASEELATYYQDASSLAIEDLQKIIVHECAGRPSTMSKDSVLLKFPNALQFWRLVWSARSNYPNETLLTIEEWSVSLAHFIELHCDNFDKKIFCEFTNIDCLPIISAKAAITLMEQEQRLHLDEINDTGGDGNKLTCLQQRCTEALYNKNTGEWQVSNDHTLLHEKLRKLKSTIRESLLLRSMNPKKSKQGVTITSIEVSGAKVSGAGKDSVNGIYAFAGKYDGKPLFTRRGTFNGKSSIFAIYSYKIDRFFISAIPEDEKPGSISDIDLYNVASSERVLLPPENGWQKFGAHERGPRLRYMDD